MTDAEKLAMLKSLLQITDTSQDTQLNVYLSFSEKEIINWRYGSVGNTPLVRAEFSDSYGSAKVANSIFINAVSPSNGSYVFTYSESNSGWMYGGSEVSLADYGITYTGLTPIDGETITVTCNDRCLSEFDMIQIMSCIVGYSLSGNEGQSAGSENGISRTWKYADMAEYIHKNVVPYAGII